MQLAANARDFVLMLRNVWPSISSMASSSICISLYLTSPRPALPADIPDGGPATLRLRDDVALRFVGRQHTAPDLGDGGVTYVREATVGIEAVLTRTARRLDVYSRP